MSFWRGSDILATLKNPWNPVGETATFHLLHEISFRICKEQTYCITIPTLICILRKIIG